MPSAVIQQQNILKSGNCPHGVPLGACPICSGMSGGGIKRADHRAKPGEMSWAECAAIGAMLRAQKAARQKTEQSYIDFAQKVADFNKTMMKTIEKTIALTEFLSNKFPAVIAKPINFIINTFVLNGLKLIKNIPSTVQHIITVIFQKYVDVSDKISAVIGEIKTALSKKIGEPINTFKKKLKSIFSIFTAQDTDNDRKDFEEAKKIFNLKTFIHNLYNKLKNNTEEEQR